ncbi:hypothetical protein Tco_0439478 [Tanacetum coccineum]
MKSLGSRKMSSSEVDLIADTQEDVEVPSTTTSTAQQTTFKTKKVYVSDTDLDSDDDTPINLHGVVDWELLPTGLGWVNVIYRKDNSRKCFSRLRESFT